MSDTSLKSKVNFLEPRIPLAEEWTLRVLHVDDEPSFLEMVKFFLERDGEFEVTDCESAEEALEKLGTDRFDAIIADYSLPKMNGIDLLRVLRTQGNDIPFVLLTGRGSDETATDALNSGADLYLQKGSSPQLQFATLKHVIRQSVSRRRSETESIETSRLLSDVFYSIQDGIVVLDREMTIVRVNPMTEKWYAHCMPIVGKKCYEAFKAGTAPCPECPSRQTLETGKATHAVIPRMNHEGEQAGWLDLFNYPVLDRRTGELTGVIQYARDITDQRRAEDGLAAAIERYHDLEEIIGRSPVVIITWQPDPTAPETYVSSSISQFGYDPEDFHSGRMSFEEIIHPDDRARVNAEVDEYLDKGAEELRQEYRVVTKSKDFRWVSERTYAVKDASGRPTQHNTLIIDVTAQKLSQDKLEDTASRLQAITQAFPDLYFVVDLDGTILDYKAIHEEDLYVPSTQFLGKRMQDILPPDVGRMFEKMTEEVGRNATATPVEYPLTVHGEVRHYEGRSVRMPNNRQLVVVRDITDRKKDELDLKAVNDKLSLLGHVTRHDTLNQLAVLMGWLDIARDQVGEVATADQLSKVKKAALAIQKDLEFTADYQSVGVEKPVWVDLDRACRQGFSDLDAKGVAIGIKLKGVEVYADPMLAKVFHNLADNSLRHGGKVTKIGVRFEDGKDGLKVVYEDDGVGIEDSEKQTIFNRGSGRHTGYGLHLIKGILGITGIAIQETGVPGEGARFELLVGPGSYRMSERS